MILIYTHHITPRVNYSLNVVFKSVLNIPFEVTINKDEFEKVYYLKLHILITVMGLIYS